MVRRCQQSVKQIGPYALTECGADIPPYIFVSVVFSRWNTGKP